MREEDLRTPAATLWLRKEGFVQVELHSGVELNLEDVKEIIATERSLAGDKEVPMFIDMRQCKGTKTEARDFWMDKKTLRFLPAVAFLIRSPLSTVLGNFYLEIHRQSKPKMLFTTSESEAIDWIKGFIK
jgi:hypothetical protein